MYPVKRCSHWKGTDSPNLMIELNGVLLINTHTGLILPPTSCGEQTTVSG